VGAGGYPNAAFAIDVGMDDAHWPFVPGTPIEYTLFLLQQEGFLVFRIESIDRDHFMIFCFFHVFMLLR
jgi:hypothetical protein